VIILKCPISDLVVDQLIINAVCQTKSFFIFLFCDSALRSWLQDKKYKQQVGSYF